MKALTLAMKALTLATIFLVAVSFVAASSPPALAHGGGLDRYGCHHDRRRGGYHCHRAPAPPTDTPRQLYIPPQPVQISRDTVIAAQTLLNHMGCEAGTPDGSAGAVTNAAVERFSTNTGRAGGAVDPALVRRLAEAVAAGERC